MVETKSITAPAPPPPKQLQARSVQVQPLSLDGGPGGGASFVLWMASVADYFTEWGRNVAKRDRELRDFWHTEPYLAGAVYTCAISNASLEWELDGPKATTEAVHDLLNQADMGRGWKHYATKLSIDVYTQDNGAFTEIVREANSPTAPILGIAHLDAARCVRTGNSETPVLYTDMNGIRHALPWYAVITHEEFPAPVESMFGVQFCATTRVLRAAQVLRDIAIYRGEKAGGRFADAIHVLGGVKQKDIEDVRKRAEETGDNQGLVRYLSPLIIGSLDPTARVSSATIELKNLPEGFDYDNELRWYINSLALGFGRDYQDFAPLPGRNLGSSTQSEVLHLKSRGKGPAAFISMLEQAFNFHGVMPRSVTFRFRETDIEAERQVAEIKKLRAEERKTRIDSGEIDPLIARQLAQDAGDLTEEHLAMMAEQDVSPDTTIEGEEKPEDEEFQPIVMTAERRGPRGPLSNLIGQLQTIDTWVGEAVQSKDLQRKTIQDMADLKSAILYFGEALSSEHARSEQIVEQLDVVGTALGDLSQSVSLMITEDNDRGKMLKDALQQVTIARELIQSSEAEIPDLVDDAARQAREELELRSALVMAESQIVDQSVIEHDKAGRMKVIRKKYASGRTQDYEIIRDKDGRAKNLKQRPTAQ